MYFIKKVLYFRRVYCNPSFIYATYEDGTPKEGGCCYIEELDRLVNNVYNPYGKCTAYVSETYEDGTTKTGTYCTESKTVVPVMISATEYSSRGCAGWC